MKFLSKLPASLKMRRSLERIFCGVIVVSFVAMTATADDEIDDVESDMDAALAESDAAESEAIDAQKRLADEQEKLARAKEEASNAKAQAQAKEIIAKSEISELDAKINDARKERGRYEKQKADALAKIELAEKRIAEKKLIIEKVRAERNAGRDEKDAQLMVLSQRVSEQRALDKQIADDRAETQALLREINQLKEKIKKHDMELKKNREKAMKVAAQKKSAEGRRDQLKRTVSSLPQNVSFKVAKTNCNLSTAAKDGAPTAAKSVKGKKYEIHKSVGDNWLEMQVGRKKGFAPKSCF
jgi:chromosome segregation ATPase